MSERVYAIYSHGVSYRSFRYRIFTEWVSTEDHLQEKRRANTVGISTFSKALVSLGDSFLRLETNKDVNGWMLDGGWAFVPKGLMADTLKRLLETSLCVRAPTRLFFDVRLKHTRARAAVRRTSHLREQVLTRDGHRCLVCKKTEEDGVELTMHHVIPFSKGGETTADNLITLCKQHNQDLRNDEHPELFSLAGLHHGWDPSLIKTAASERAWIWAMNLSDNIVVSACKIKDLPVLLPASQALIKPVEN